MSQVSANMVMPLLSALPEKDLRMIRDYCDKKLGKPKPKTKKRKSTMDKVADQLGEEWRPGNEDMLLANILTGN